MTPETLRTAHDLLESIEDMDRTIAAIEKLKPENLPFAAFLTGPRREHGLNFPPSVIISRPISSETAKTILQLLLEAAIAERKAMRQSLTELGVV